VRQTVVALLLLLNCAGDAVTQPAPAKPNMPRPGQTGNCVGVMSLLGDKFTVKKVGYFLYEEKQVSVESWHIDDLITAKISGSLGKRAAVRRVPYRKDAFAPLHTQELFRDREAEFREILRAITAGTRCARYVVVTRGGSSYGATTVWLGGLGIVAGKKPYFTGDLYNLYTLITVRVYDGENFSLLTRKVASIEQSTFLDMIRGSHREVDESFWPASPEAAAQNIKLREAIRELVAQSIDATLPELQLTE
jgi:hypothetical protein